MVDNTYLAYALDRRTVDSSCCIKFFVIYQIMAFISRTDSQYAQSMHLLNHNLHLENFRVDVYTNCECCRADVNMSFMLAVLSLRNTHGFRRYAQRAYAPLRPAMCSTATRSVRIRQGGILIKHNHDTVLFLSFSYLRHMPRLYYFFKAFRIFDICRVSIFSLKSPPIISFARKT